MPADRFADQGIGVEPGTPSELTLSHGACLSGAYTLTMNGVHLLGEWSFLHAENVFALAVENIP
jgi:hypothetical protein